MFKDHFPLAEIIYIFDDSVSQLDYLINEAGPELAQNYTKTDIESIREDQFMSLINIYFELYFNAHLSKEDISELSEAFNSQLGPEQIERLEELE